MALCEHLILFYLFLTLYNINVFLMQFVRRPIFIKANILEITIKCVLREKKYMNFTQCSFILGSFSFISLCIIMIAFFLLVTYQLNKNVFNLSFSLFIYFFVIFVCLVHKPQITWLARHVKPDSILKLKPNFIVQPISRQSRKKNIDYKYTDIHM